MACDALLSKQRVRHVRRTSRHVLQPLVFVLVIQLPHISRAQRRTPHAAHRTIEAQHKSNVEEESKVMFHELREEG